MALSDVEETLENLEAAEDNMSITGSDSGSSVGGFTSLKIKLKDLFDLTLNSWMDQNRKNATASLKKSSTFMSYWI